MSELFNQIQSDLKQAMLAKDQKVLDVLRMLKSAIKNFEIANPGTDLTDDTVIGVVQKQLKQRSDAAGEFKKAGRAELAEKEEAESEVLKKYVPAQISDDDLFKVVKKVLSTNDLNDKKQFGKAMKLIQDEVRGAADNRRISQILNGELK